MENKIEQNSRFMAVTFQHIVDEMKGGPALWEDFFSKVIKFNSSLKNTVLASSSLWDSFQSIADTATNTRGSTKEIGAALTRFCIRQRSVESKIKKFNDVIADQLIEGHQERLEEWRKRTSILDKEHSKDYKKIRSEIKKLKVEALKLTRKIKKDFDPGSNDSQIYLECRKRLETVNTKLSEKLRYLEESETRSLRNALAEEHNRLCTFVTTCLKPVMDSQIEILTELTHVQEISDSLMSKSSTDPEIAFGAQWEWIEDIKKRALVGQVGTTFDFDEQTIFMRSPREESHSSSTSNSRPQTADQNTYSGLGHFDTFSLSSTSSPFSTFSNRSTSNRLFSSSQATVPTELQDGGDHDDLKWRPPSLAGGRSELSCGGGGKVFCDKEDGEALSNHCDDTYLAMREAGMNERQEALFVGYSDQHTRENSAAVESRLSSISSRDSGFNSQETPAPTSNPSPSSTATTTSTQPIGPTLSSSHYGRMSPSMVRLPNRLPLCPVTPLSCSKTEVVSLTADNISPSLDDVTPMGSRDTDGCGVGGLEAMLSDLAISFQEECFPEESSPSSPLPNINDQRLPPPLPPFKGSGSSRNTAAPLMLERLMSSMSGYNLKSLSTGQPHNGQSADQCKVISGPGGGNGRYQTDGQHQQRFTTCNGNWLPHYENKKMNRNSWCNSGAVDRCIPYNPFVIRSTNSFRMKGAAGVSEQLEGGDTDHVTESTLVPAERATESASPTKQNIAVPPKLRNRLTVSATHGHRGTVSKGSLTQSPQKKCSSTPADQQPAIATRLRNMLTDPRFPSSHWFAKGVTSHVNPQARDRDHGVSQVEEEGTKGGDDRRGLKGGQSLLRIAKPTTIPNFNQSQPHQVMMAPIQKTQQPPQHFASSPSVHQSPQNNLETRSNNHGIPHLMNIMYQSRDPKLYPSVWRYDDVTLPSRHPLASRLTSHEGVSVAGSGGSLRGYGSVRQRTPQPPVPSWHPSLRGSPLARQNGIMHQQYQTSRGSLSCHTSPTKIFNTGTGNQLFGNGTAPRELYSPTPFGLYNRS